MANDLNQCTFTGRLGADPETKSFQNGGSICQFRIAVGEQWKDKQSGERKERTEWVPVVVQSEGLVKVANQYLRKGSRVLVGGRWKTRKWTDQGGADRYSTELVLSGFDAKLIMLDGAAGDQRTPDGSRGAPVQQPAFADDLDDQIPFLRCDTVW